MRERSFDDFDSHAMNYREVHSANVKMSGADSYYFAEHKVKLLNEYEQNSKSRLLDLGCGDGLTDVYFSKYFPAMLIDGIDISEKSIAEADKKQIPRTSFTIYDGQTIPFEDNYFDIVFVASVLHHIDFSLHQPVLHEIHRVLKPGGRLYIFEHNPINPVTRYFVSTCSFDKGARLLGHSYSKKLLKSLSFRDIHRKFILFFPRKGLLAKLIRHEKKLSWLPLGGQYFFRAVK